MHIFLQKYFFINKFDTKILDHQESGTTIIYRNYQTNKVDLKCIIKLKNYCKINKFKFLISNNFKLALMLNLDGAYIPAFNKSLNIRFYKTKKQFIYLGSAHNINEIKIKEKQKINCIFLSPFFQKKNKLKPLGIYRFNILKKNTSANLVCLGGITKDNIKTMNLIKPFGIAAISLFTDKFLYS